MSPPGVGFDPKDPNLTEADKQKRFHQLVDRAEGRFHGFDEFRYIPANCDPLSWDELRAKEQRVMDVYSWKRTFIAKSHALKYKPTAEEENKRARVDQELCTHTITALQDYRAALKARRKKRNEALLLFPPRQPTEEEDVEPGAKRVEAVLQLLDTCIEDLSEGDTMTWNNELRLVCDLWNFMPCDEAYPNFNYKNAAIALREDIDHQQRRFVIFDEAKHYLTRNFIANNPLRELWHVRKHVSVFAPLFQTALVHTIAETMNGGKPFPTVPLAAKHIEENKTTCEHPHDNDELDKLLDRALVRKGKWYSAKHRNDIAHPNNVKMRMLAGLLFCERYMLQEDPEALIEETSDYGDVELLLQSYRHSGVNLNDLLGEILCLPDRVHHPPPWQVHLHIAFWPRYADAFTPQQLIDVAKAYAPYSTSSSAPASATASSVAAVPPTTRVSAPANTPPAAPAAPAAAPAGDPAATAPAPESSRKKQWRRGKK